MGEKDDRKEMVRREREGEREERERRMERKGEGREERGDRVEKRGRNSRIGRATLSSTRVSTSGIQHFIFYTTTCFLFDWLERVNYKLDTKLKFFQNI